MDCLVAGLDPSLGQHFVNIAKAQGEAEIEPNGLSDDIRREPVPFERDCLHGHSPDLGANAAPKRRKFIVRLTAPDVDPWQEAAELAQLSRSAAAARLATLTAELPNGSLPSQEPGAIAARLLALLPRDGCSTVASRASPHGSGDAISFRGAMYAYAV